MEKEEIKKQVNRIWKDNEDKTFHYQEVTEWRSPEDMDTKPSKEERLAFTKKELQRFAEIIVEELSKLKQ